MTAHMAGWQERTPGVSSAGPTLPLARALHTQPFEASGLDLVDVVEAGVQVGGCLGKTRGAL